MPSKRSNTGLYKLLTYVTFTYKCTYYFILYFIPVRRTLKGGLDIGDGLGTWRCQTSFLLVYDVWTDKRCNYRQLWKFFKETHEFFYVHFFHVFTKKKRTVCKRMRVPLYLLQDSESLQHKNKQKRKCVELFCDVSLFGIPPAQDSLNLLFVLLSRISPKNVFRKKRGITLLYVFYLPLPKGSKSSLRKKR